MEHEIYKSIDTLTFEGSNITVNCRDPVKVWKLSDEPVVIPLDSSRNHKIRVYSFEHMKPTIELGDRSYTLGIDNHSITSVHDQPLSPYKIYNISLTCDNSSRITCSIKENNITIEIDTMSSIPEHVSFGKASPGHFYIMLPDAKDKRQSNKDLTPKLTEEITSTIKLKTVTPIAAVAGISAGFICSLGMMLIKEKLLRKARERDDIEKNVHKSQEHSAEKIHEKLLEDDQKHDERPQSLDSGRFSGSSVESGFIETINDPQ